MQMGQKIEPNERIYADFVQIIFGEKCITRIFNDAEGDFCTLEKIQSIAQDNGCLPEHGFVITVIADSPLSGVVCQFGNHGAFWMCVGITQGYA